MGDEFEFIRVLGTGAFGTVHLVKSKEDGKQYAMKVIDLSKASDADRKLTLKEAEVLSDLSHPNILAYLNSFQDDDDFCIVTEYCSRGDLAQYLAGQNGEKLQEIFVKEWFREICMALDYLHKRKIIHRDVKTQNVFLTEQLETKLGDMGLAKILDRPNDKAITMCGSPYYMSPEIFSLKPYDMMSDIWALAVIVYEMATLEKPFDGKERQQLVSKIVHEETPAMPTGYDSGLVELLTQMMQKDPEQRPSASTMLEHSFFQGARPKNLLTLAVPQSGMRPEVKGIDRILKGVSAAKMDSLLSSFSRARKQKNKRTGDNLEGTIRGDTLLGMSQILTHTMTNKESDVKKFGKKSMKKNVRLSDEWRTPIKRSVVPDTSKSFDTDTSVSSEMVESGYKTDCNRTDSDIDLTLPRIEQQVRSPDNFQVGAGSPVNAQARPGSLDSAQARARSPYSAQARARSPDSAQAKARSPDNAQARAGLPDNAQARLESPDNHQPGIGMQAAGASGGSNLSPARNPMMQSTRSYLDFSLPLEDVKERVEKDAEHVITSAVVNVLTLKSPGAKSKKLTDDSDDKKRIVIQIEHLQQYIIAALENDMGIFNYIKEMLAEIQNEDELETTIVSLIGREKYDQIQLQLVYWKNFEYTLQSL